MHALVRALKRQPGPPHETRVRDLDRRPRDIQHRAFAERRRQRTDRHAVAQRVPLLRRPGTHQIPCRIERGLIIEQSDPERRQGANLRQEPAVRPAHFQEPLHPHIGE